MAVPVLTFAAPVCVIAPPAETVSPVAFDVPRIKSFTSVIATAVPFARTVPKSFDWLSVMAYPLAVKFDVPETLAAPDCVIAPLAVTVRLVAVIKPRSIAPESVTLTFVPHARTVPKLFVELLSVIFPVETIFARPLTVRFPPDACVIAPPNEFTVRFVAVNRPSDVEFELTRVTSLPLVVIQPVE